MVTELLFTHDKLISLNLGNNKIDHDGIIGILSVLNSSNYTLEELNIDNPVYKTICQSVAIHLAKCSRTMWVFKSFQFANTDLEMMVYIL